MNAGSACSNHSSSVEAEPVATSPVPVKQAETTAASPTQPPTLNIASPTHSLTYSNKYTPPAPPSTTSPRNRNQTAMTISRGSLCANIPQAWQPSTCTGNYQRNQHHLETIKMDEDFFGKDLYIHLTNKDARPWLCVVE